MRIAFVGKGGAGKTTLSALCTQYVAREHDVLAIDADINMHMAELLGVHEGAPDRLISEKIPSGDIRTWLRGTNSRIPTNDTMKKTTPPGKGSRLIRPRQPDDWFMSHFATTADGAIHLVTVGSYSEDGIASSCYHNNLSVLENVLTHTVDDVMIVADMVAGTDAFASTLFTQFDVLMLVVEPTRRSVAVFEQYQRLAQAAGVEDLLFAVGNKIADADDEIYLKDCLGDAYIGGLRRSEHIARVDKGYEQLDVGLIDENSLEVLHTIELLAAQKAIPMQQRLEKLWELHRVYVAQAFVRDRFGDLTTQIDETFEYPTQ